jgi:hypothetical protein
MRAALTTLVAMLGLFSASAANADWHGGKILRIQVAYDGSTITFVTTGYTRNNCLCYANWGDSMCLNRDRLSFKEEVALLYLVRARGGTLNYNIDETTCRVVALYETD